MFTMGYKFWQIFLERCSFRIKLNQNCQHCCLSSWLHLADLDLSIELRFNIEHGIGLLTLTKAPLLFTITDNLYLLVLKMWLPMVLFINSEEEIEDVSIICAPMIISVIFICCIIADRIDKKPGNKLNKNSNKTPLWWILLWKSCMDDEPMSFVRDDKFRIWKFFFSGGSTAQTN